MSAQVPFQAIRDTPPLRQRASTADAVNECVARTAEALRASGAATGEELHAALAAVKQSLDNEMPADLLVHLAHVQGYDEEQLPPVILHLSDVVAAYINPSPPMIPFAGKLIAPSSFYESFEQLHKLGRALLSPVIYAEDTDAIGVASINPVAAQIFSEEVLAVVDRRFGIKPFLTVARLDYESWAFLTRKHFGV